MTISAHAPAFALSKWYFDCVAADGRTAIAYASELRWRGFAISWSSIDVREGPSGVHRTSTRRVPAPREAGGMIQWQHGSLGATVSCESLQPSFASELHPQVQWTCVAPAAHVRIGVADAAPVQGPGYAEHLQLTVLPWRLGIDELRWGRWIADDGAHSMVWIDWRGANPLTRVFVDGVLAPRGDVGEMRVDASEQSLSIEATRTVMARTLGDVLAPLRKIVPLIPRRFLGAAETKWSGRGILTGRGGAARSGSTLHEIVSFR